MKKTMTCVALLSMGLGFSQTDFNAIFTAGVADAEVFMNDYLAPVSESAVYGLSAGWYNTADAKPLGGFEISVIGNFTGFRNKADKKTFVLDPSAYQNLDFVDNPGIPRAVSTGLGDLEGIAVFVEANVAGVPVREEITLPAGLSAEGLNFMPTGFVQASVGLLKGTEAKARFLPKIAYDGASVGLIGFGLQHDFTKWLPADKVLPIAISGVIGYTRLTAEYDFTGTTLIEGEDQRLDLNMATWAFNAVVSTKLPIINFYGGLGYITGTSETDVLGTYRVTRGPFASETYTDPFSIAQNISGVTANVGAKLKLGFFRLNADYTMGAFNTMTFGVNFGFR